MKDYLSKDKFKQEDELGYSKICDIIFTANSNNEIGGIYNNSEFKIVKSLNSEPFMITMNSYNSQKHTFYFEKNKLQKMLNINSLDELYSEHIIKM